MVLPQQDRSTHGDLRFYPDLPLVNVLAAVETDADGHDSFAVRIPFGVVDSWLGHDDRIAEAAAGGDPISAPQLVRPSAVVPRSCGLHAD